MTLQEHYNAIKNGKGNKAQFLKQARYMFPEYFNQYTNYDNAVSTLKSKQIISEAVGGVVGKGFDIWDWKKILAEEVKAEEKKTSKEVLDAQAHAYDNKDMKNADNVNFNEIMKGFYAEMKDEKNAKKTGDEIKAMVVKNLAKDPLYYTKDGEFGTKGVGYTTEAPGLGTPKEPKGKHKSSGYGDLPNDIKEEKPRANVQDSLSDSEAKTSNPSKVKEMEVTPKSASGVKRMPMPGKEKKIKLQEEEIKWSRTSLNENTYSDADKWASIPEELQDDLLLSYDKEGFGYFGMSWDQLPDHITSNIARDERFINYGKKPIHVTPNNAVKADKDIPGLGMTEEQQLRSLIQSIIKEELEGSKLSQAQRLAAEYGTAEYIDPKSIQYNEDEEGGWDVEFTMNIPKTDVMDMDLKDADEYFYKEYKTNYYGGPGAPYSRSYTDTKDGGDKWIVSVKASGGYDI